MIYILMVLLLCAVGVVAVGVAVGRKYFEIQSPSKPKALPRQLSKEEIARARECAYHENVILLELDIYNQIKSLDSKRHVSTCPYHMVDKGRLVSAFTPNELRNPVAYKKAVERMKQAEESKSDKLYRESIEAMRKYRSG